MFSYKTVVQMHDTDAAERLFFGSQFKMMHDAYQALFGALGLEFGRLLKEKPYFVPIVHAEADFKAPLFVGDRLLIEVEVPEPGTTSFTLVYRLTRDGIVVGTGKTVHVCVDKATGKKISLGDDIHALLEKSRALT